jgi:hypothetical protein
LRRLRVDLPASGAQSLRQAELKSRRSFRNGASLAAMTHGKMLLLSIL